jgi:hypothetical protein
MASGLEQHLWDVGDIVRLVEEWENGQLAGTQGVEAALIEREIVAQIAATGIRLRFDKVALRLVDGVKAALRNKVPDGQTVIFTITAPIRHPAKTATALENLVLNGLPRSGFSGDIHDNQVRIRWVTGVGARVPKVFGFVHNSASDALTLFELAESRLRSRLQP